jgi:kynurenine formamidase
MSKNQITIIIGETKYLVVDLTQPLKLDVEVFPGDPKPQKEIFSEIEKTGYQHHVYKIGDHNFQPHGDAPKHQNPDLKNKGFEFFGIDYCFNRACLIDLSNSNYAQEINGIKYLIEVKKEHLEPFAERISQIGAVLIRTGYDKWLEENKPHVPENLPFLSKDASELIASFSNVKVVGIDSLTIDPAGSHFSHKLLKDKLIVESLVHLHKIPFEKRLDFDLQTSPVRIAGATGGPIVSYSFIKL